ncbi:ribokinase [Corynebacterium uropygiale]|uniref:Ribokinase n=1 Tax=Corynebacterium uropygiale TaxID=1775911 RepID=A0A9X1U6X5_9CORY|nr:ribokinase [Corynebacterium uropygiale]MCF4006157.1 ribokinase [Corynebacterium uropygiale]
MSGVIVVGSINADLNVGVERHPHPGETLLGHSEGISPGGKGANQAVAAALLGAEVAMVGAVGTDPNAAEALRILRSSGVDLRGIAETEEVTGLAVITVSEDGENTIIVVPGANRTVDAAAVEKNAQAIADADLLILQGEIPASGNEKAVEIAAQAGTRVLINLAPVVPMDPAALRQADPLMANEHEAGLILEQLGAAPSGDTPQEMARALIEEGFRSVVLTLGSRGSLVAERDGERTVLTEVPSVPVHAVDTTGAGDAFAGAFAARLVAGDDLPTAAAFASRVGAFAVTGQGAQPSYPTVTDELPGSPSAKES